MSVMGELPFSMDEYRGRQDRFLSKCKEDALILIPTNPVRIRSNDTSYPFRIQEFGRVVFLFNHAIHVRKFGKGEESEQRVLLRFGQLIKPFQ